MTSAPQIENQEIKVLPLEHYEPIVEVGVRRYADWFTIAADVFPPQEYVAGPDAS